MDNIKAHPVNKPKKTYASYIATALPIFLLIALAILFTWHQEQQSMFEDLDQWCESYHPELTYRACYDKAGINEN